MHERTGRVLDAAARLLALAGGALLLAAGMVTVASVVGRALVPFGFAPIKGDFELVSMACAPAIFAFLPWCQLRRGHVTVDMAVAALPPRIRAALGLAGDLVMTAVAAVILWRLWIAFGERLPFLARDTRAVLGWGERPFFPERSAELGIALWIPYAASVVGAALFLIVCLYTVWRGAVWTVQGQEGRA